MIGNQVGKEWNTGIDIREGIGRHGGQEDAARANRRQSGDELVVADAENDGICLGAEQAGEARRLGGQRHRGFGHLPWPSLGDCPHRSASVHVWYRFGDDEAAALLPFRPKTRVAAAVLARPSCPRAGRRA